MHSGLNPKQNRHLGHLNKKTYCLISSKGHTLAQSWQHIHQIDTCQSFHAHWTTQQGSTSRMQEYWTIILFKQGGHINTFTQQRHMRRVINANVWSSRLATDRGTSTSDNQAVTTRASDVHSMQWHIGSRQLEARLKNANICVRFPYVVEFKKTPVIKSRGLYIYFKLPRNFFFVDLAI